MAVFDTPREAFGALRPVCVQLSQAQTAENVRRLQARLEAVGAAALQELQEYVLFPLRLALLGPRPERLLQSAVQCVASILGTTRVRKRELLLELFSELSTCLSPPPSSGRAAPLSEELKLGVIEALHTLLHAAEGDVILSLYQPASLPLLGFAVSQLLGLAEQERAKQIKVSALSCLQVLVLQCDCGGHGRLGEDEERRCGDLLASFLPGLCVALSRVITGDVKQGHKPAVAALRLFYLLVGSVVADAQLDRVPRDREKPPPEPSRVAELMVHRGPEWSKNTAEKLSVLLHNIVERSSAHPHWRVRLELVELAQHLLRNCSRSLLGSCGQLLRALVGLVSDESDEVRGRCLQALRGVAERGLVGRSGAFTDILSESLHGLATALPRLVSAQDDAGKASTLGLLLGYLKLLGPKINAVLNSASHLQRLSGALLQVLELDVSEVKIVEGGRWGGGGSWQKGGRQRKYFRFFADEKVFQLLQQVCRVLGYYGNLYLLVDHFMGLYGDSGAYRQQAAMVLNELLAGAAGAGVDVLVERDAPPDTEDLKASIVSILDEYTDQGNWYLVTSAEAEESVPGGGRSSGAPLPPPEPRPAARTLNANAWQICIQLEGVGCFAAVLGAEFRPLLLSTLYPLLEKAGDKTPLIGEAALGALAEVCQACGYASLGGLIKDNADYLVNGISLSLRQPPHRPRAARVLAAMLSHSDATLLPLLDDVVQDVLAALDLSYSSQADTFLGVLHALLTALAQWFGPSCGEEQPGAAAGSSSAAAEHPSRALSQGQQALTGQDLERFFLDYVRQKQIAEGNLPDTEEEEEEGEVPPLAEQEPSSCDTDGEAPLPGHAQLAKAVLERCVHLLSHESLRVRLKVLDVLELCVTVLHPHRNHLLPMAHRLWPALLPRLTNDDPLAVLRAFKVLCTLAQTCGDFLRQRVSKDVLPKLTSSLLSQAPVSARAGPVYSHTLAFKLQLAVLQGLGSLCEKLDMGESDLNSVADACLLYLSAKQPVRLQEAAQSVFLHLMHLDPDSTWLLLSEVCCPQQYQPPHASLRPVRLGGTGRQRDHFAHNVLLLLERLREWESTAARREPSPP